MTAHGQPGAVSTEPWDAKSSLLYLSQIPASKQELKTGLRSPCKHLFPIPALFTHARIHVGLNHWGCQPHSSVNSPIVRPQECPWGHLQPIVTLPGTLCPGTCRAMPCPAWVQDGCCSLGCDTHHCCPVIHSSFSAITFPKSFYLCISAGAQLERCRTRAGDGVNGLLGWSPWAAIPHDTAPTTLKHT